MHPKYKYPLFLLIAFMLSVTLYFLIVHQPKEEPVIVPVQTITTAEIMEKTNHSEKEATAIVQSIQKVKEPTKTIYAHNMKEADDKARQISRKTGADETFKTVTTKDTATKENGQIEANYYVIRNEKQTKLSIGGAVVDKKALGIVELKKNKTNVIVFYDFSNKKVAGAGITRVIYER